MPEACGGKPERGMEGAGQARVLAAHDSQARAYPHVLLYELKEELQCNE